MPHGLDWPVLRATRRTWSSPTRRPIAQRHSGGCAGGSTTRLSSATRLDTNQPGEVLDIINLNLAPVVVGCARHVHASDTTPEAVAEWVIDLTGDTIVWRRAHEKAAVAVRGSLTDLLLVLYRRRPALGNGIEVLGDSALLDFWMERVAFE